MIKVDKPTGPMWVKLKVRLQPNSVPRRQLCNADPVNAHLTLSGHETYLFCLFFCFVVNSCNCISAIYLNNKILLKIPHLSGLSDGILNGGPISTQPNCVDGTLNLSSLTLTENFTRTDSFSKIFNKIELTLYYGVHVC